MHDGGTTNAALAWGLAAAGFVATIASVVAVIAAAAHHAADPATPASPIGYGCLAVSIVLAIAGLYCLSTVSETTCTFDKEQSRFIWRHKQVFQGVDEKRYPITSIKSIEVTQKKSGSKPASKDKKAFWWFIVTKSGVRFEEPGAGSPTPYEADSKANYIRAFLGKSLVPTGQDTDGNERGIGDRTVFGVLAQLTDPSLRNKGS
jgi:hypothetical protein